MSFQASFMGVKIRVKSVVLTRGWVWVQVARSPRFPGRLLCRPSLLIYPPVPGLGLVVRWTGPFTWPVSGQGGSSPSNGPGTVVQISRSTAFIACSWQHFWWCRLPFAASPAASVRLGDLFAPPLGELGVFAGDDRVEPNDRLHLGDLAVVFDPEIGVCWPLDPVGTPGPGVSEPLFPVRERCRGPRSPRRLGCGVDLGPPGDHLVDQSLFPPAHRGLIPLREANTVMASHINADPAPGTWLRSRTGGSFCSDQGLCDRCHSDTRAQP